jgi:hypothetical protein
MRERDRTGPVLIATCAAMLLAEARALASPATATDSTIAASRTRTVVAGDRYHAGGFHRFLLGSDYRHLWTAPVEIPELNLHAVAGGLRPVKRVGGQQTLGLALKGADGRDYTFRGLDKDPTEILPPEFRGTFVDRLLQDQIASSFPGGAVAVAPLLEAAGVLHADVQLVVMPDDSLLGEFRATFAGLAGTFEEFPTAEGDGTPGSFGATEIINGEELWKRRVESPVTRPDARAFLAARLMDVLIGDWDRHRGQWRWARIPGKPMLQPIPEDRDQAFVRFEGLIASAGRQHLPQFVSFGDDYPSIDGLTWNGRDGDRRILVDLEKQVWDEVARDLRARITDEVIASAVARLPEAYRKREGANLESALRSRRDKLPAMAERYYLFLARDVDVHATDEPEIATIERRENGDVAVSVSLTADRGPSPWYQRVFRPDETDEVRLYLHAGADSVITTGESGDIAVRVIGGDGNDVYNDAAGTGLHISDAAGENHVVRGSGTRVDTRTYVPPRREKAPWIPPRDWGRKNIFIPWIGGNSDLGVLFLGSLQTERYGFRKHPYASRQTFRLGYATEAGAFGGDYRGEFIRENSETRYGLYVRASGLDVLHFFGFGNETLNPEEEDFYKVKHTEYTVEPSMVTPLGNAWTATLRLRAKYSKTNLDEDRFITTAPPYGSEDFFQAGAGAGVMIDTRDSERAARRGLRASADGNVYPALGGVEETFGEVHAEAAYYQPIPFASTPVFALRAGGRQVWGPYPWHEAATVGGAASIRGFAQQRFAGDSSLYGSAELRIPLARMYILVPGSFGLFGFGDAGRVFLDEESSDRWHTGAGGGAWFSFASPDNTASVSIAGSDEGTRIYIHAGLAF